MSNCSLEMLAQPVMGAGKIISLHDLYGTSLRDLSQSSFTFLLPLATGRFPDLNLLKTLNYSNLLGHPYRNSGNTEEVS